MLLQELKEQSYKLSTSDPVKSLSLRVAMDKLYKLVRL